MLGKSVSYNDYQAIIRKSSMLPPKLPGRPATLRLNRDSANSLLSTTSAMGRQTFDLAGHRSDSIGHNGQEVIIPNSKQTSAAHTVKLPTRDTSQRSILKRWVLFYI